MTVNGSLNRNLKMNKKNLDLKYKRLKERFIKKDKENNQLLIEIDKQEALFKTQILDLKKKNNKYKNLSFAMILILFIFMLTNFFIYNRFNSSKASQSELQIKQLAEKISLANEEPILIKIKNTDKLLSNPSFANIQIGDTVLIYNNAKLMLVYTASQERITSIQKIDFEI